MFYFHNGRYRCEAVLGSGSYGDVWRAWDGHLGRYVALKLLHKDEPLAFATREAIALTALEGPHVLRVLNADRHEDIPYLATEIVEGGTAQDRVGTFGVPCHLAVRWARHALVGLGVCHRRQLLHRDVKPANIFLASDDEALIGDFGVVAALDTDGTTSVAGTWGIRAPECWTLGRMTTSSDLYSVGVALFVMLTGTFPFVGATETEVGASVLAQKHPKLRDLAPHVPLALAKRVQRAMAVDPNDRYQTAEEFHEALGEPDKDQRIWRRVGVHDTHEKCWVSGPTATRAAVHVCVTRSENGFAIEARRSSGSKTRILSGCATAQNEAALAVALRRIFTHL